MAKVLAGPRRVPVSPEPGPLVEAVAAVEDPALFLSLGELGTLRSADLLGGQAVVVAEVLDPAHPAADELRRRIADAAAPAAGGAPVRVELRPLSEAAREALGDRLRARAGTDVPGPPGGGQGHAEGRPNPFSAARARTRVLAISSGKGGVGKSSVTVNLAVALAAAGHRVGLLDADIYGFSVPRMLGVDHPPAALGRSIVPPVANGVRCVSMGFFVDEDKAVAWRGPMLHKAIEQFLVDVHWGPLDFLLVDMPPGTGDVPLSIASQLPGAEVYVVTTPQPAAQRVAQRAAALAKQVRLPVRGVIENLSWFTGVDGTRYELFGAGGGEELAATLEVPLLARIPLVQAVRQGADEGLPAALAEPGGEVARAFAELAEKVAGLGPARVYRRELSIS